MKRGHTRLCFKGTFKNAVEVLHVHGNVAVQLSVIGGGQNHFAQNASIAVCTITGVPKRKANLFLSVPIMEMIQQMADEFKM